MTIPPDPIAAALAADARDNPPLGGCAGILLSAVIVCGGWAVVIVAVWRMVG